MIIEGEVSPYHLGFFRMNVMAFTGAPIEPYVDSMCTGSKVGLKESRVVSSEEGLLGGRASGQRVGPLSPGRSLHAEL